MSGKNLKGLKRGKWYKKSFLRFPVNVEKVKLKIMADKIVNIY
jgi:hypothetical protein